MFHFQFSDAEGRPINKNIDEQQTQNESHQVAPVATFFAQSAKEQSDNRTDGKHRFGHDEQAKQQQIVVNPSRIVGDEVRFDGHLDGVSQHQESGKPP